MSYSSPFETSVLGDPTITYTTAATPELYQQHQSDPSATTIATSASGGLLYMPSEGKGVECPNVPTEGGSGFDSDASSSSTTTTVMTRSTIREDAPEFIPRASTTSVFHPPHRYATVSAMQRPDPPQLVPLTSSRGRNWSAPVNWAEAPEFVPKGKGEDQLKS